MCALPSQFIVLKNVFFLMTNFKVYSCKRSNNSKNNLTRYLFRTFIERRKKLLIFWMGEMEDSKYFVGNMISTSVERRILINLSEGKKGKKRAKA